MTKEQTETEMLEQIAFAIMKNTWFESTIYDWQSMPQFDRDLWIKDAKTAVEEYQKFQKENKIVEVPFDPTTKMLQASTMIAPTWDDLISKEKYQAMLETYSREKKCTCDVVRNAIVPEEHNDSCPALE